MFFFHINIDCMYILVLEVRTVKSGTKNGTNEWFSWNRMRKPKPYAQGRMKKASDGIK